MKDVDPRRLRAAALPIPFHIVLVEPEIPPNTGNIARLCAATQSPLHLVGKLGFRIDEHSVRRAGLDYWHLVNVRTHPDLPAAEQAIASAHTTKDQHACRSWLFSGRATRNLFDVQFAPGDALVFGKESVGLAPELLEQRQAQCVAIPTLGGVRSLNLANSVSIALYEALRQVNAFATTQLA